MQGWVGLSQNKGAAAAGVRDIFYSYSQLLMRRVAFAQTMPNPSPTCHVPTFMYPQPS